MPLITDFNQPPYYDDFDELKNFHRILFKPGVAVQARELTQLQAILQNQIERFGDNVLKEGTIVAGGNFVEEAPLPYVKVRDIAFNASSQEVATDVNQYVGMKAVGRSTGVEGFVIATEFGLETQSPDLATLFVRYTKSAIDGSNNNISTFSDTEEIELFQEDTVTGDYSVLFHRVTAAGEVDGAAVGDGYGVRTGDGIIFQKGNFIRFDDDLTIVSKYSDQPDGVVVGFETIEQIIDSNEDSTLLDPANGFNNFNAPGADRVQLVPKLVVRTVEAAEDDENFFALQEYEDGQIVRRNLTTQYNQILDAMETRTFEESGDYVVDPFRIRTSTASNNTVDVVVSAGVAYVNGKRVQTLNDIDVALPPANTYSTAADQDIVANYGGYYIVTPTVTDVTGRFDFANVEPVNFKNSGGTTIGTGQVRAFTNHTVPGQYRLYLFNVKSNAGQSIYSNATRIESTTLNGDVTIVLENGKAKRRETTNHRGFFPTGRDALRTVDAANTDYIFRKPISSTSSGAGLISITVSGDESFPYGIGALNSDQIAELIVISTASVGSYSVGEVADIASATAISATQIDIQLTTGPTASMGVEVVTNVKNNNVTINQKTLETIYVKVNPNTHTNGVDGPWSLGVPDVHRIKNVYRQGGGTFTGIETNTNKVNDQFSLNPGQWQSIYRLSHAKKARNVTLTTDDRLLFEIEVFKKDANPGFFFTVDSYPTDDTSSTLPAGFIRTESIPAVDGFRLRDAIDVRPQPANTATYAATSGSATVNPSATEDFSGSNLEFPAPNATIETSYDYYLGRIDKLIIDEFGNFQIIEGSPDDEPSHPRTPDRSMELAVLKVPPFPSLTSRRANRADRPEYGVTYTIDQNKRYTMKDIGDLDRRIENIEYYTALSALETSARDLSITDSNGLNKFKNGIFVDNFNNLLFGNVRDDDFAASIDPARKVVQPKFRQYPIDLKYSTSSANITRRGDVSTFTSTEKVLINQPYATTTRSCTTDFYRYNGNMQLDPEFDPGPETQVAPDINLDFDFATPLIEFTEALAEFVPLQQSTRDVSSTRTSTTTGNLWGTGQTTTTTTTTTIQDTIREIEVSTGQQTTQDLGDFVTDVSFSPFMRSRRVQIHITGLRPNTRHYFFFDGQDVDPWIAPAVVRTEGRSGRDRELRLNGQFGAPIISNSNGEVSAIFWVPKEKFYVGDAKMEVIDRPTYQEKDNAASSAAKTYTAYNFSATKTGVAVSTRLPETSLSVTSNTSITTQSFSTTTRWEGGGGREGGGEADDPIAQTFIIDPGKTRDNSIMVSSVDLFFAGRSRTNKGVTVQIRETNNGFPAGKIVPFSNVHLRRNQVNVNTVSAATKTTITFDEPIILRAGREYAIVVKPDGNDPDYRVWVSKTGQNDVDKGVAINQDTNSGTLFTSTNNRAWTPYQDENMKFTIRRHQFNTGTGTLSLTNQDHEFFTIDNVAGDFEQTEKVFRTASAFSGSVAITSGNNTITGTGTTFNAQYEEGQYIVIEHATDQFEVLQIDQIVSDLSMIVSDTPLTTASTSTHYSSPVGELRWFTIKEPSMMMLINSSARASLKFANSDSLVGAESSATATLTSIDDLPISYIEPKIFRANFNRTDTKLSASRLWDGASYSNSRGLRFGKSNFLYEDSYYLRSKSNDPTTESFRIDVTMTADVNHTSPTVDHGICSMMAYQYIVNNDGANETATGGNADSKYISKTIELADGQDSEDIRVYIDAYRPPNTNIHVYVKFQADADNRDFDDVEWTRLRLLDASNVFSSAVNRNDYREFEFDLKQSAPSPLNGGGAYWDGNTIIYNDPDGNQFDNFKRFAVKIVMLAPGHNNTPQIKNLRAIAVT